MPPLLHLLRTAVSAVLVASVMLVSPAQARAAAPGLVDDAQALGLRIVERTWSATAVDYDHDGLQDVWLGFHQHTDSRLMRNQGNGTYTWVARDAWHRLNSAGRPIDRHDCAWADFDRNGWIDAVCSVGRVWANHVKGALDDNELWLQQRAGVFVDVGTAWGIGDPCGRGRHIAVGDFNGDGWMDVFMGNDKSRGSPHDPCDDPANGYPNPQSKVFLNQGGQRFVYAPVWGVTVPAAGIGCARPLDFNHDGLTDVLACNYRTSRPELYRNTGTRFVDDSAALGLTPITDAVWGDLDGDGVRDLVMSDLEGFLWRRGTAAGFGPPLRLYSTHAAGIWGWGVALGDINGDGRADVYGLIHDGSLATNPDDVVLLNTGSTFTRLVPPSATGNADSVTTIRPSPGGRPEFLVENGKEKMDGPIQVIGYR